ncbi:helix-turn-helix domain-containing protein [Streptomyces sp. NPDC055134]
MRAHREKPADAMVRRRRIRRRRAEPGRFAQGPLLALLSARTTGGLVLLPGAYEPDVLRALGPVLSRVAPVPIVGGFAPAAGRDAAPATARRAEEVVRTVRRTGRPLGVYGLSGVLVDYHLAQPRDGDADVVAALAPHPELRATPGAYLAADRDRRRTAAVLDVHPNTVDKRLIVSGMAAAEPDVRPADNLTPQGMKVLEAARDGGCLAEVFRADEGLRNADFVYGSPCNGAPELAALLARHSEPPVTSRRPRGHWRGPGPG